MAGRLSIKSRGHFRHITGGGRHTLSAQILQSPPLTCHGQFKL